MTKLYGITLDCPDPVKLSEFYQQLTGMVVSYSSPAYVGLASADGGPAIGFQQVENFQAPEWPGQRVPQQIHLDFAIGDQELDDAEANAISLGATRPVEQQPDPDRWRVLLDPAGHPFCLAKM